MSLPDGYYNCEVGNVDREEDRYSKGNFVAVIYCTFQDYPQETATARIYLSEEEKASREFKALGLTGEVYNDMENLESCIGNPVRVSLKVSKKSGNQNAYIATAAPAKKLTKDEYKAALARKNNPFGDETPF